MVTVPELTIAPRRRGRPGRDLEVEFVRELEPSDLALLASGAAAKPTPIARLRDRHHALARCLALGMSQTEAAATTGYCASRISILLQDPSFKDLVEGYRNASSDNLADFQDQALSLARDAVQEIADRLEAAPESISTPTLLETVKTLADRSGYAPIQKSVNVNANVDLGSRMEAARRRLAQAQITSVEPLDE